MPRYTVTEPHPTVVQNSYTRSGRGGAGNYFRAPATTPASGVVTEATSTAPAKSGKSSSSGRFYSGRGGAGNVQAASTPRPVMSFDEEFNRQSHIEAKPIGHVGRGGAGNVFGSSAGAFDPEAGSRRKASDASTHSDDSSSSATRRMGFLAKLTSRH